MLKIYLVNLGKYNAGIDTGKWIEFPVVDIEETLESVGVGYNDEYLIVDYESDIEGLDINQYESLEELNEFAKKLENLSEYDKELFTAILDYESNRDYLELIDKLEDYNLYTDINNDEDLGAYWLEETAYIKPDNPLYNYIDTEKYGQDIRLESQGCFTQYGWIEYVG